MNDKSYVAMLHCAVCGEAIGVVLDRRLKDTFEYGKSYTDGSSLCDKCQEQADMGSILFKCAGCGSSGWIIMSDNTRPLIEEVREKLHTPAPKICGLETDECPECRKEA